LHEFLHAVPKRYGVIPAEGELAQISLTEYPPAVWPYTPPVQIVVEIGS
jgi:hypothetical protein